MPCFAHNRIKQHREITAEKHGGKAHAQLIGGVTLLGGKIKDYAHKDKRDRSRQKAHC